MGVIRRILPLQSGVQAIEYAVVATGVLLAISAVVALRWLMVI
jgi:Flp pilus assembly pilin Flp